ncbi:MAG TPA: STAS domain-containing protein [Steroidobacteraceae bacterium]|nr:STAS domain-containing protein [Steroidobacteraceae bacterium]
MSAASDKISAATIGPTAAIRPDAVLRLPAQCTIRDAAALLGRLLLHIEQSSPVYIDAAQVERVDTATLQLLVAFLHDRKSEQRAVVWLDVSEAMMRAARALGLARELALAPAG